MPYKDRETYLQSQRDAYGRTKESRKWEQIKRLYGVSKDDFNKMMEEQNNSCKLCSKPFISVTQTHIDHCHETDRVRGILCMPCNVALGMLGDNEEGLTKALNYVKGNI